MSVCVRPWGGVPSDTRAGRAVLSPQRGEQPQEAGGGFGGVLPGARRRGRAAGADGRHRTVRIQTLNPKS